MRTSYKLIVALLLIVSVAAAAQDTLVPDATVFSSARTNAIGGPHAALADDITTLFNNPAGFRSAESALTVAELTLGLTGPIFDITSIVIEGTGGNPADIINSPNVQTLLKNLYAGLNLLGPISLGYVGNGLGFGLYSDTLVEFSSSGTVPTLTTRWGEEVVFAGGYAFRIPLPEKSKSTLDIGVLLKAWLNGVTSTEKDTLGLIDSISNPESLIVDGPFDLTAGLGVDLGVRYSYNERFAVGVVGRNLPAFYGINHYNSILDFFSSPESPSGKSSGFAPIDLSAGVLFRPPLGIMSRYISDVKLMLDYQDILDFLTHPETATNPVLHAGLGMELVLLEILSIRAGFYQGLLSAGLGFDLSIVSLNIAMFGTELSTEPGIRPVYNLLLGLEFRL